MKALRKALTLGMLVAILLGSGLPTRSSFAAGPPDWQQSATGLATAGNANKKTAGLTITIAGSAVPFASLQGGVVNSYDRAAGPTGIDLGEIKVPGVTSASLVAESADWAHDQMTFATNLSSQYSIWISRLSPAVLISSQATSLRLFSGNLGGATTNGATITNRAAAPSYPKYVAYSSGGTVQVKSLAATSTALPALDNNWLLVWYGANSHFLDTNVPISYSEYGPGSATATYPQSVAYQADAPMLLVFQNAPSSISQSPEGGIDVTFSGQQGYVSLLPLLGRQHPPASDTESWSQGLPADVLTKINFWVSHACAYPTSVSETYGYDATSDTVNVSENITFLPTCTGGTPFAILPPALALAKDALGATVSGTVIDAQLPTEFGPILGIGNTTSYTWSVAGLKKYTDSKRVLTNTGTAPSDLQQELANQVQKLISAGHMLPWMVGTRPPVGDSQGDMYFLNPADVLYHLAEISDALSDPVRSSLIQYMKTERASYPPETVFNLPNQGTVRGPFGLNDYTSWQSRRPDVFLTGVPLYTFYGLARYYEVTQETIPSSVISAANTALNQEMAQRDWASFGWFKGFAPNRTAVVSANRHLAGMIGYVKLTKGAGDTQDEALGRALLAKAAVLRVAMAKYPRYLYSAGLFQLPTDPAWQPKYTAGGWAGYIFNYSWTGPYDDPQQVVMLDQFGTYLYDHTGYMEPGTDYRDFSFTGVPDLAAYEDLVPESFRLLGDCAKADLEIYANKVTALEPQWYVPFAEATFGFEHNINPPVDSFQIFMAKALLQNDTPANLARYASFPWIDTGDLFYMQKLAEAIKAYEGVTWQ